MLTLDQVCKSFHDPGRGEVRAVDGVSAAIAPGVTAIVGANGAGKSTLLRMVATLLAPDGGSLRLDDLDLVANPERLREKLGYLSTTTRLYPRLTGRELLRLAGGFFGLDRAEIDARALRLAGTFGLERFLDQRISGLSTGEHQRLNLARTLLHEPSLLVLDEPTTGLDVVAAWRFVEAVRAARADGRHILLATHVLREVESAADHLLVLRAGKLVFSGAPAELGSGTAFEQAIHALVLAPMSPDPVQP